MATYRLSAQVLSRSAGRSAVAAAAYRSAELLRDEQARETHDFRSKKGVEHSEVLAPEGAPEWALDRAQLWNKVERAERRHDAQVAREVQLSLPKELSDEAQLQLVRRFAQEQFVVRGMVVDLAIHRDNPDNPHAHLLMTMRPLSEDGRGFGNKERAWNDKQLLLQWRQEWAHHANRQLERDGFAERIDHRSYEERGVDLVPQPKLYRRLDDPQRAQDGREDVGLRDEMWQLVARENGERIRERPEIVFDALTGQQAVFSRDQMLRFVHGHTADKEQFDACMAGVWASEQLVELGLDGRGQARYTTQQMLQTERGLLERAERMLSNEGHQTSQRAVREAESERTLSQEQSAALHHITRHSGALTVVEGHAGAGKSYMLGAAREAWETMGYQVVGGALAAKAAEGLEDSSGIGSRTLASWEWRWQQDRDLLDDKTVMVIDEAAMVGTAQLGRVLEHAERAGAKVVLVGDSRQLQAIEAGAPMRMLGERYGCAVMREIRRQREFWQQDATQTMAAGDVRGALWLYEVEGHLHSHYTQAEAQEQLVRDWDHFTRRSPGASTVMLAYRRADVEQLNLEARRLRQGRGELGEDWQVQTEDGLRAFAENDRVLFRKNDRELGVSNGTVGTVESLDERGMVVRLDDERRVAVALQTYRHLQHGYASTVHKSQGMTVDRAWVLASQQFDAHATYVAMSRHRDDVRLYWSPEEMGRNPKSLFKVMSRQRPKRMALDFARDADGLSRPDLKPEADVREVARQRLPSPASEPRETRSPEAIALSRAAQGDADLETFLRSDRGEQDSALDALLRHSQAKPMTVEHAFNYLPERLKMREAVAQAKTDWNQARNACRAYEQEHKLRTQLYTPRALKQLEKAQQKAYDDHRQAKRRLDEFDQGDKSRTPERMARCRRAVDEYNGAIEQARVDRQARVEARVVYERERVLEGYIRAQGRQDAEQGGSRSFRQAHPGELVGEPVAFVKQERVADALGNKHILSAVERGGEVLFTQEHPKPLSRAKRGERVQFQQERPPRFVDREERRRKALDMALQQLGPKAQRVTPQHYGRQVEHVRTLSFDLDGEKASVEVFQGKHGQLYVQYVDGSSSAALHQRGRSVKLAQRYYGLSNGRGWDRGGRDRGGWDRGGWGR